MLQEATEESNLSKMVEKKLTSKMEGDRENWEAQRAATWEHLPAQDKHVAELQNPKALLMILKLTDLFWELTLSPSAP